MEEQSQMDLTYITERIISILCPAGCPEDTYLQDLQEIVPMLQSKHGHNYMLINLSQKHPALTQMNHKVLSTGWLEHHAPSLDQIFNVCTTMENWLLTHPKHVLVLHCRGDKGRLGVLVGSYIHFSNMFPSPDLSLDHVAMSFYNDKLSAQMTPSQKRYVWMLRSVLTRGLRMSPSPFFLLCVVLYGLPKMRADGGCCLFLRVYQSLQAVCTSALYHLNAAQDRLYVVLQPAQLLKGDIMVVCYDKNSRSASRRVVFRLQFHTGLVVGRTLSFSKADLDCACEDPRFPDDGKVDLVFSGNPEKIAGSELWHNSSSVTVDYDTLDPLVRRDSYHSSSFDAAPPHLLGPGNESLYSEVKKKSSEGDSLALTTGSPSCRDRVPSASSDSGLSITSQGRTETRLRRGPSRDQWIQGGKLIFGVDSEPTQPLLVMTEVALPRRGAGGMTGDESGLGHTINGEASSSERETDILDDEDEGGPGSACSLSSENTPESKKPEYSTHSWVRQQQMVEAAPDSLLPVGAQGKSNRPERDGPPPLVVPETPPRGLSSREAVQRGLTVEDTAHDSQSANTTSSCQEDELASLTTDIDVSIEQLNQLILDLDPTFVPVPTRCSPLTRSASLNTNGLSLKGRTHQSGWKQQKHFSDVMGHTGLQSPRWRGGGPQSFKGPSANSPAFSSSQHGHLNKTNSVDFCSQMDSSDISPVTPTFPMSPPTPYVKHFSEFSQLGAGGQWDEHSWTEEAQSFLDGMIHGGSADGELFRSDVPVAPASCQRTFGSVRSASSGSPLPHTNSSTPPPLWLDRTPNSLNSPYPPQPSPPLSLHSPNAHSSPRGASRGPRVRNGANSTDLSSLLILGNGGLDHSLLDAVEGLGSLTLGGDGGLAPLLPEKKRAGEGGELGSRSPPLSGFSSPHSDSGFSIRFSSSMTPDPLRGLAEAHSPGADSGSKQDNVKFVQDTSKFWYKPDISRDQAIAVLKDKEPGSFIVRDSHSFRGAYGLAMKVATPPPTVLHHSKKGDLSNELVRHFLIECTPKGVRLKGCPNEPYFGSLTALVCQHSITPLALPCKLILPDRDPLEELNDSSPPSATNSAAELLRQGAACNVWYLGSVEMESLTGQQAVQKATTVTLSADPPPPSTVVHFKVSAQGITLTDNQRKLFFRRHYAVNTVIFCSLDSQGRKWTRGSGSTAKIFGFVAKKSQSDTENVCHLFAEHDPEQPASAIVNFVSKVMIGSHKK
ncbi:tensin-3 [Nematolebias whitei]|uniref:tensin-3 n=1 Tax=Nematolebias whitei TaxID=451745 RepID=UPI0018975F64|nr:tensin-3 [Nematolebias whitei]